MEEIRKIGDYEIVRELSRSSIASVYEGYQPSLDRRVLIKRLHPQLVDDTDILARFEREARSLARIKHKNIVHIYDYQATGKSVHLVVEWISGGSLAEKLRDKGQFNETEILAIAIDILEGLEVAHNAGIIHRDIKPNNLLISQSGYIKITDFGLAQFEGAPSVTMQGTVIGTPAYIAPEVVAGQPADFRCDLYAVGVTLYELITGINPFNAENISQVLNRVMSVRPDALEGASQELQKLLFWLMEKKPEKRPQDTREVLDQFKTLAEKHGVRRGWIDIASPEDLNGDPVAANGEVTVKPSTTTIIPTKKARPSRWLLYSAWALMLVSVVVVFVLINSGAFDDNKHPYQTDTEILSDTSAQMVIASEADSLADTPLDTANNSSEIEPVKDGFAEENEQQEPVPENNIERIPAVVENQSEEMTTDEFDESDIQPSDPENELAYNDIDESPVDNETVQEFGYIMLHVDPWANIYHENRFVAQTPYNRPVRLPAGIVELRLDNPTMNLPPVTRSFYIPQGDTLRDYVELMSLVGEIESIAANPWAEVILNGESIGKTPISSPIYLPFGRHEIHFIHPAYAEHIEILEIKPNDQPYSVWVDLTK